MKTLPRIPEYPQRLGRKQQIVYEAVLSMAISFDGDPYGAGLDPRRASATLLGILRSNLGWEDGDVKRAAKSLVDRRILKESNVGWSLADEEFERLQRQARRERDGFRGD